MLKLNEEKEELLVQKYGFEIFNGYSGYNIYKYGKTLRIWSKKYCNSTKPSLACSISINSVSRELQDLLYDLIKDDILIKVPNEDKEAKIMKLEKQKELLQEKINKLKGE